MSSVVSLGLIQMSMTDTKETNLKKATRMIEETAAKGVGLVILPELFLSPYFCQKKDDRSAFESAETIPGPTTTVLSALAKKCGVVLVGGSIFEKADGKYFNTTPVFERDGTLLGIYRKTHIPEDILYHEQHYFAHGDTGVKVFETSAGKIAPLICYDQWYPEIARIAVLKGAEILCYPTAIGTVDATVEENITGDWGQMWHNVQLGHAAANCVYVAAANRTGKEGAINFWGGSFVADPSSAFLAKAGDKEEVIIASCDLTRVRAMQESWRFLANRRPDQYQPLTDPL